MRFGFSSIRSRMITVSIVLMLALLAAAFRTDHLVSHSIQDNQTLIRQQAAFSKELKALKDTLYSIENGLYQYAVLNEEDQGSELRKLIGRVDSHVARIDSLEFVARREVLQSSLKELQLVTEQLTAKAEELVAIITDHDRRFPASPTIRQSLYPANIRFASAVEDALADSLQLVEKGEESQRTILDILNSLRYQWSQQIGAVRMYLANRSGVFGAVEDTTLELPNGGSADQHLVNRANYAELIRKNLVLLQQLAEQDKLSFLQSIALEDMLRAQAAFERHFETITSIYEGGNWRADIPLMRESIQPLFSRTWGLMYSIERHLSMLGSNNLMQVLATTDRMSMALWVITAMAGLALFGGVLVYEFIIRRPVYQVVHALDALGEGSSYTPILKTNTKEIDQLLRAFRDMQRAVYTRERRLSSILDNASEGIITINEEGTIETFNNAAESLFGYNAEEVIGRNVSLLMPHPTREEHDEYIRRYLETGEARVIGNEMNVNAQRRDGTVFPMSIKLNELELDGRRYFSAIVADISERKAMMDHLRHLAEHDSLTGLYNRQYLTEELERVVQRSLRQHGLDCALLYIDLDNFKYVNDSLGHLAGDRVLIEVSSLIAKRSRKSDLVARLGGDEFAVLVYDVNEGEAQQIAEAYRKYLSDYQFREKGQIIDIGCSIGVAPFTNDLKDKEELLARADIACHMAKRAGRNQVHLYAPDDRVRVDVMTADMGWARTIKTAIEQSRFTFALQPIVDIQDNDRITSYEVLLRMLGEDGEVIMPSGFLPSAERFGLILDIDRWVVEHAIKLLASGRVTDGRALSINLSAKSIGDERIMQLITEGVLEHNLDARRLSFEITETIAVADLGLATEFLDGLRLLGCRTALDDFGVGYCSFAYLKDLPTDYVKIDGSFVREISNDPVKLAMVRSMNDIAHAMGKETVAEVVEEAVVLQMLREIGVDYAQGFLTGRPALLEQPPGA